MARRGGPLARKTKNPIESFEHNAQTKHACKNEHKHEHKITDKAFGSLRGCEEEERTRIEGRKKKK